MPYQFPREQLSPQGTISNANNGQNESQDITSLPSDHQLDIPKIRSTSNLLSGSRAVSENARGRYSLDVGSSLDTEQDSGGGGISGLQRIRQQPISRVQTSPSSPEASFSLPPRSASMTLAGLSGRPSDQYLPTPRAHLSPSVPYKEDLTRFPTESLHSFSFAQQSEELLHGRQSVLKRCMDFVRDKLGWAGNNAGLVTAQAKLSGNEEIQSMVDLLARANVLGGTTGDREGQSMLGPLTGPAYADGANPFEKAFFPRRESHDRSTLPSREEQASPPSVEPPLLADATNAATTATDPSLAISSKPGLKRTRTDISLLSLQTKLVEALSRPYVEADRTIDEPLLSPTPMSAFTRSMTPSAQVPSVVHGQTSRWAPPTQAVFTTEAHSPWTILAANDLACLIFGIKKAEVRKLSILEIMRLEDRSWLEEKLSSPGAEAVARARQQESQSRRTSLSSATSAMGNGITARLLSKPSYREQKAQKNGANTAPKDNQKENQSPIGQSKGVSRGVLLCGDIVPIRKRNGAKGTASLWVKEKRAGLIWVLEEVSEDSAVIVIDEDERVQNASGSIDAIWGTSEVPTGVEIWELIPKIPLKDAASSEPGLDYEKAAATKYYTARNVDGFSIPISIFTGPQPHSLQVSSFPHIAGIIVLSAASLKVTSINLSFAAALFGHTDPNGLHADQLIPRFENILDIVTEEDEVSMLEGTVIPEHSFRRARKILALREGTADAASVFLRPPGLTAKHRDGSEINIDIQVRVVQSVKAGSEQAITEEKAVVDSLEEAVADSSPASEVVLALWVTYSRQLHSDSRPGGPVTPIQSRPGTPRLISPGQGSPNSSDLLSDGESSKRAHSPTLSQQITEATSTNISSVPPGKAPPAPTSVPPLAPTPSKTTPEKLKITDFKILEDMGQGAYGQVKLARYLAGSKKGEKTVLKYVTKKRILVDTWTRDRRLGTVPLEIHVLDYLRRDGLKHPNIVEMTGFFEDDINYYIEMVPHGLPGMDLFDYIEMRPTMNEDECRDIFIQVVEALYHLHTKALVVHRDIKDENIILDGENRVKLIDFGSAAYIKNGPFDVFVGTIDYASPEVLSGLPYRGKEQDVWALGILLYTLVYKENPFYSIDEIMDHELRVPWILSDGNLDLIRRMLERDVEKRWSIGMVRGHAWTMKRGFVKDEGEEVEGEGEVEDGVEGEGRGEVDDF